MLFRANEVGAQSKKSRELAMVMRMNAARASMLARDSTRVLPLTFTLRQQIERNARRSVF
jgi:hypothetical protein